MFVTEVFKLAVVDSIFDNSTFADAVQVKIEEVTCAKVVALVSKLAVSVPIALN